MPTQQLRLFWNTIYAQFTFTNLHDTNPLGQLQTMNENFGETVVDPAGFGALYNVQDISPEQAAANFVAIQAAIDSLPDSGGTLLITGHLQYVGTIHNPMRVFIPQPAPRPIPFDIIGFPQSALVQLGAGLPAVWIDAVYEFQVGSTSAPVRICNLQVYSKGKGIVVRNGGKETQLMNVRISACEDTALDIQYFDGGRIRDVYCIGNRKDGAHIDQCHMADIVLTTRNNGGVGAVITNSAAHSLWLYTESNQGLGLVFDAFKYSRITLWEENNNGSSYQVQGKVTNSPHNSYFGIAQEEANRAFDMDDLSACTSFFNTKPLRDIASKQIAVAWPPIEANIRGPFNSPAAYIPHCKVTSDNVVQMQIPTGWYSMQNPNISGNWIELYASGWYPPLQQNFVQGDNVMVRVKFAADSAMAAYFKQHPTVDTVKFIMQGMNGCLGVGSQTANLRTTDAFSVEFWCPVLKSGVDTVRLFTYLCPQILGSVTDLQPPTPQVLTVRAMDFYLLKGI